MADKLEIGVTADTASAQDSFDELGSSIEQLGDAAEKASDKAAKSTFEWESEAQNLKRVYGELGPPAVQAVQQIETATVRASRSTMVAQTSFQKFARSMRTVGGMAVRGITASFAGLGTAMLTIGRLAGRALWRGFMFGVGMLAKIAMQAISTALGLLLGDAMSEFGKEAGKNLTDAFVAGIDLNKLAQLQGAMSMILPDEEQARDAAKALGELNSQLRTGSSEGKQAAAAAKLLGIDLKKLTSGGAAAVTELGKLQKIYSQMDQVQQRDLLKLLFPDASEETLAKIDEALENTKTNLSDLASAAEAAGEKIAASMDKAKEIEAAAREVGASMEQLVKAIQDATGLDVSWDNLKLTALQAVKQTIDGLTTAVRAIKTDFDSAAESFSKFGTAVSNLAAAGWEQIKAGIDAITGAVNSMIEAIKSAINWLDQLGSGKIDIPLYGPPQGSPLLAPQRFAGIMSPAGQAGMLRSAQAAAAQSNLMGRATPRAANDNGGTFSPAMSAALDKILWDYKEIEKQSKKTADAVDEASARMAAANATVAGQLDVVLQATAMSDQALVDWAASVLQAADPTFAFRAALAQLDEAFRRGIISADQYAEALKRLKSDLGGGGGGMGDAIANLTDGLRSFGEQAADSFVDAAIEGEDFSKVLQQLLKDLAKLLIKTLIIQPLMDSLFGAIGAGVPAVAGIPVTAAAQSGLRSAGQMSALNSNLVGRSRRSTATGGTDGGGAVTNNVGDVNIDMSQTGMVTSTTEDGKQFGLMVQRAVEGILVRESRPGGILRKTG